MGKRLEQYFEYAKEKGGLAAQMRMAMKFGMPSTKAAAAPDTPESVEKAKALCQEVLGDSNIPSF
jgi:hypothetical protein